MANERDDKYENQEEGEYHFSDDHVNYETESEASKTDTTSAGLTRKETIIAKLKQHRRTLIGVGVILVLLFVIYKMLTPAPTVPATEISQLGAKQAPTVPAPAPAPKIVAIPPAAPVQPPQQQIVAQQPSTPPPAAAGMDTAQVKMLMDRLTTLEEQNTKIANLLQTEYAQKMTDYETQNRALQTKLQDLSTRLSMVETNSNRLTRSPRSPVRVMPMKNSQASVVITPRVAEPKMIYTVQAIIPGRAWLKSDAGDTVTVAEGDVLKGYGRVTKIDPYDGVVVIDTGSKMITLSYGVNGD